MVWLQFVKGLTLESYQQYYLTTRRDHFESDHSSFETSMLWLLHLEWFNSCKWSGYCGRFGSVVSGLLIVSNCNGIITSFEKFDSGCLTSFYGQIYAIFMPRLTKVSGAYSFCLVRPSVRPFSRPCVRPTFCRHYSSETIRRSILIFIYVIS